MVRKWDVGYWVCGRVLHPAVRRGATGGRPGAVRGHGTVLVVTFRANGEAVPTPLSCAVEGGRIYASTAPDSGKVKRIRRDPRVLVAASTVRGRPLGGQVEAVARVLGPDETHRAERVLDGRFGLLRRLYRKAIGADESGTAYLEITPKRR